MSHGHLEVNMSRQPTARPTLEQSQDATRCTAVRTREPFPQPCRRRPCGTDTTGLRCAVVGGTRSILAGFLVALQADDYSEGDGDKPLAVVVVVGMNVATPVVGGTGSSHFAGELD